MRNRVEYIPYVKEVKITEKKAPTDESIKLYDELREKAFKSVTDTFQLNNNMVHGVVVSVVEEYPFRDAVFHAKFKVNGVEYSVKKEIPRVEFLVLPKTERSRKLAEFLFKSFSETISREILKSIADQHELRAEVNKIIGNEL